jgi:hypothetical protein
MRSGLVLDKDLKNLQILKPELLKRLPQAVVVERLLLF